MKKKINPQLAQRAEFYVSYDIDIFPLEYLTKFPPPKGWQDIASQDPADHAKWFTRSGSNIGVRTGDGLLVVDVDTHGGKDGMRALKQIENKAGQTLPSTFTVRTPTGGIHYYYFYDPDTYDVRNSANKLGDGVDIRGEGGYVVGADSTVEAGAYTVEVDADIADAPTWFLQLVERKENIKREHAAPGPTRKPTAHDADALGFLPADEYDDWYQAGMACKETFGEDGFELWRKWSATSPKYEGVEACAEKWRSFETGKAGGITFASIVHRAKEVGYKPSDTLAKSVRRIGEAVAAGRAMDSAERRIWLQERMPAIYRGNLPVVKKTAGGEVSSAALATVNNVGAALDFMGVSPIYNAFTHECEVEFNDDDMQDSLYEFEEPQNMLRALAWQTGQAVGFTSRAEWDDAINTLAMEEKYNPVADWISEIPWDGVDRFGELADTVTLRDDADRGIFETYLRRWLIQGVQAAFGWKEPKQLRGCFVLSGPQECGKTTWFGSLVPPWAFKEGVALSQFGGAISGDSVRAATGGFVTELGELETTFSKADAGALKNFLTATHDEYRVPFGRRAVIHPRTTIFCGTVNHTEFLRDSSGSSRFWPVAVLRCNGFHNVNMQQVWAQAHSLWVAGETWFLTRDEAKARAERAEVFTERTQAMDAVLDYWELYGGAPECEWITVGLDAALEHFGIQVTWHNRTAMRDALTTKCGYSAKKIRGERRRWLIPPRKVVVR